MSVNKLSLKEFNQNGLRESARFKTSKRSSLSSDQMDASTLSSNDQALLDESGKPKRNGKYNAKKVTIDGIEFDSTWEGQRYSQLKVLEKAGEISDLQLQVSMPIEVNGVHICKYVADFVYHQHDEKIVEDAKGVKTAIYSQKKKLIKAVYGIDIKETYRPKKKPSPKQR